MRIIQWQERDTSSAFQGAHSSTILEKMVVRMHGRLVCSFELHIHEVECKINAHKPFTYVYTYTLYIYIHIHICTHIYLHVYMSIGRSICPLAYTQIHGRKIPHAYTCVECSAADFAHADRYLHAYIHKCMHTTYPCTCTYMHTHTYT